MPHTTSTAPPSPSLLLMEVRAIAEFHAMCAMGALLRLAPRGDGHPVLVLPGLAASDASTAPLRTFLKDRGYKAHGWQMGPNFGPRPGREDQMQQRLAALHRRHGQKVSVVGWSLGGIFAREMARRAPEQVRSVITLGSPFAGAPYASNAWRLYEYVSGCKVQDWPARERMKTPPPVPATAIYSRSDGVVAWQGCLERGSRASENIEVQASHCGLGYHPAVLYAVADRLAQPAGHWRPFHRQGLRRLVYADPYRDTAATA